MSKKISFRLFVISLILIMGSFIIGLREVVIPTSAIFNAMLNPYIAALSVGGTLILGRKRYHRLIMLTMAIITAVVLQFLQSGEPLLGMELIYKFSAFYVYIYLVILARYMA